MQRPQDRGLPNPLALNSPQPLASMHTLKVSLTLQVHYALCGARGGGLLLSKKHLWTIERVQGERDPCLLSGGGTHSFPLKKTY